MYGQMCVFFRSTDFHAAVKNLFGLAGSLISKFGLIEAVFSEQWGRLPSCVQKITLLWQMMGVRATRVKDLNNFSPTRITKDHTFEGEHVIQTLQDNISLDQPTHKVRI